MVMGNVEIPKWLEGLPFAPEFRPSDTEFADPIAYISKIEKEASVYGICKIIPPLPKPSKRYVFAHLNKSLAKCPDLGDDVELSNGCSTSRMGSGDRACDGEGRGLFTTRHQELGQSMKRMKGLVKENPHMGVQKQVWQSGEAYTLEQFESKSKAFARSLLGVIKEVNPSVVEALFWKATSEKPIYIEYANDVPGSAFGEPEGQFHYFRRQRRKRASYKSYRRGGENSDCKKTDMDAIMNYHKGGGKSDVEIKDASIGNAPNTSLETTIGSTSTSTSSSDETLRPLKHRSSNGSNDMEGTAGWKLSNCPWNLQVIARSPGSLTRFMPDDIPGVTSPMIYIGMLFSWFAWHVEDHELHSMNFLHTGSPKTWYAVPGDYAFAFEEVIRSEVYGGSIDRLAVLTLLGEKTTLLSPEIVVSSGIPCCRLIQNPGEFVVTFPRAYHVGFSHGFNCGEAANFGTPQWLKVAKDAAVRRAAMNYLPMLSHQQLLYLLTMSFVLRVPRSLLPGARSSRLRDRQKEDRELSVKKAFIDDITNENDILYTLLAKDPSYHVKIWNPDILPSASKEFQLSSLTSTNLALTESDLHVPSEDCSNALGKENNLSKEMSLYMENLNDLYGDSNDLSCDFQVDSGTLPCVACGILGFPFMTVIQPSEKALMQLLPMDHNQEKPEVAGADNSHLSTDPVGTAKPSGLDDLCQLSDLSALPNDLPFPRGWNKYRKFCRPRIFCLEHAVQIEELLQSKGGANLLVVCHSDYQKMKAYASAISEEIDFPFHYKEISLENASQEDLHLIDHAIDDEGADECEDWTSILGVNLQHCVKVRKNSPSKKVEHALDLAGLFGDRSPGSYFSDIRWQNRRCRTRIKLNQSAHSKPCDNVGTYQDEVSGIKSDNFLVRREEKLIQYSRKKHRVKRDCSIYSNQEFTNMCLQEVSVASCDSFDKQPGNFFESSLCKSGISGSSSGLFGLNKTLHEVKIFEATENVSLSSSPSMVIGLPRNAKKNMGEIENQLLKESNMGESGCNAAASGNVSKPYGARDIAVDGGREIQRENKIVVNTNTIEESCNKVFERPDHLPTDMDICTHLSSPVASIEDKCEQQENFTAEDEVLEEVESSSGMMLNDTNQPAGKSVGGTSETQLESSVELNLCSRISPENDMHHAVLNADKSNKEHISCSFTQMDLDQRTPTSMEEESELLGRTAAQEDSSSGLIVTGKVAVESLTMTRESDVEEPVAVLEKECFELPAKNYAAEDLSAGVNLHIKVQQEIHSSSADEDDESQKRDHSTSSCVTEPVCNHVSEIDRPAPASVHKLLELEEDSCDRENIIKSNQACSMSESTTLKPTIVYTRSISGKSGKRKNEMEQRVENLDGFIRSPCERLRSRAMKDATARNVVDVSRSADLNLVRKRARRPSDDSVTRTKKRHILNRPHKCDLEGCNMSFETKAELRLHKRDRCTYEGCNKKFSSHRYALVHQRVHEDDRPLKCPWEGCSMSFKWAWARTEHIRVHTGEKPYQCTVEGCGLSFRFVSDYSRHRRKTGHYESSPA